MRTWRREWEKHGRKGAETGTGSGRKDPPALADLRAEIDRIDEAMHRLLMERGDIIDRLIAVKKTSETGSAFRPGREAAMMRALAARHAGLLPLDTVGGHLARHHRDLHLCPGPVRGPCRRLGRRRADARHGPLPLRLQRALPPARERRGGDRRRRRGPGDLGIFRLDQGVSAGAWWRDLVGDTRPKVIARLPFIERPGHPAGTPVFVVSKPLADAAVRDVVLYAASFERWGRKEQSARRRS